MNTINIGVVGNGLVRENLNNTLAGENFYLSKIFITDQEMVERMRTSYPQAEIVENIDSIINDEAIELVIMPAQPGKVDPPFIKQIVQAGKHVRLI